MANVDDHLTCSGFDVWINVDGVKETTYGVKTEGDDRISCCIVSTVNKEFTVSYRRKGSEEYDYLATVTLDGHIVDEGIYDVAADESDKDEDEEEDEEDQEMHTISSSRISLTEKRTFVFGSTNFTDRGSPSQIIGDIKVCIQRIKILGVLSEDEPYICGIPTLTEVDEHLNKRLIHRIKYGPVTKVKVPESIYYDFDTYGGEITFIFNYRPLDALQADGIVARPVPVEACTLNGTNTTIKREYCDWKEIDSEEDIEEMFAKAHALMAKIEKVRNKRHVQTEVDRNRKKVKVEPITTHFAPGEVIDLT